MALAAMYAEDEDALYCDLAETYGIFDWQALPVNKLAVLACGLPDDSRIKRKISDCKVSKETLMLAAAIDRLSLLVWFQTKDGEKGRNRPKSVVDLLLYGDNALDDDDDVVAFDSEEEFMAARAKIFGGIS